MKKGRLDADLVTAAGQIHDFAKGQKGHAPIGRQRLLEQDQPELAVLVGAHMGDGIDPAKILSEKDILYLADKMVKGDRFVGIHGRFTAAYEKYGYLPQLQQRGKKARAIAGKIEAILGVSPETYCKEKVNWNTIVLAFFFIYVLIKHIFKSEGYQWLCSISQNRRCGRNP